MSKAFALGFCVLVGIPAQAMPAVGDYVKFNIRVSRADVIATMTEEFKFIKYDQDKKTFTIEQITTIGDHASSESQEILETDLFDEKTLTTVLQHCEMGHGVLEPLMVKSKSLDACRFNIDSDGEIGQRWYGVVPMGVIKSEIVDQNGIKITKELMDYGFGTQGETK